MKRYNNIYEKICNYDNLQNAHLHAKKGKSHYTDVKIVNENEKLHLSLLKYSLENKTYKTSDYIIENIIDKGKSRTIHKLPYYPDRICQWAVMLQIEPIFMSVFTYFSCASIPKRGVHYGLNLLKTYLTDKDGTKYCLKLDVKKFFENVDHGILKNLLRKKFKDKDLLWLLDEIIDSVGENKGLPLGNYTSQYFANFYLSYFDHWIKEQLKIKYVIRYMDDIVILSDNKEQLHKWLKDIKEYLNNNLLLELKDNYQIFPTKIRGIDFLGYRCFGDYILLRKNIAKNLKKKTKKIYKKIKLNQKINYSDYCSINSYKGWIKHCNGHNFYNKYIYPLNTYLEDFYHINIYKGGKNEHI